MIEKCEALKKELEEELIKMMCTVRAYTAAYGSNIVHTLIEPT